MLSYLASLIIDVKLCSWFSHNYTLLLLLLIQHKLYLVSITKHVTAKCVDVEFRNNSLNHLEISISLWWAFIYYH